MKDRLRIQMYSSADKVEGQGVGSAYKEQIALVQDCKEFQVFINTRDKADIYHFHTVGLWNFMRMKIKKGTKVSYVHFLPDTLDGSISLPRFAFRFFKRYVKRFYQMADELVVVNPIFIEPLKALGIPETHITYIPNFVSSTQFYRVDAAEKKAWREAHGYKEDDFIVIGVGQIQTRKGVLDFVETAKAMPQVKFIWCGGFSFGKITDGYEELKRVVAHPPKNVNFTDIIPREEMNTYYNISDVLFMPSYQELFPMAILEAVQTGIPLVLRNLELYEDILFHGYSEGRDVAGFVKALQNLQDHDVYVQAQKQTEKIRCFYTKEHVQNLWREYYLRIYQKQ